MKYIDVTLTLKPGMRGVSFEQEKTTRNDGWNAKMLHLYSHAGTHMDAPVHFDVTEETIDQMDASRFFCTSYIVDLPDWEAGREIKPDDLGPAINEIQPGEGLIFRTGWSRFADDPIYRQDIPGISRELALWCVEKGISMIGVEPPSVTDVNDMQKLTIIHQILLGGNIIIVEGLANLAEITKPKVQFIALPLKIMQGDGAPCRAIVIENDNV